MAVTINITRSPIFTEGRRLDMAALWNGKRQRQGQGFCGMTGRYAIFTFPQEARPKKTAPEKGR